MPKPFKVIHLTKLRELDLGEDFVKEIIQTYIEEIPQYLSKADDAFKTGDRENLRRILHTFKSHSKTLCMSDVNEKLTFWEKNIREVDLSEFRADFLYLKQSWNDAVDDLKSLVNGEQSF